MKRGLAINVGAVDVNLVVGEKCNYIMNVGVSDGMEHDVVAHLFDAANHL